MVFKRYRNWNRYCGYDLNYSLSLLAFITALRGISTLIVVTGSRVWISIIHLDGSAGHTDQDAIGTDPKKLHEGSVEQLGRNPTSSRGTFNALTMLTSGGHRLFSICTRLASNRSSSRILIVAVDVTFLCWAEETRGTEIHAFRRNGVLKIVLLGGDNCTSARLRWRLIRVCSCSTIFCSILKL